MATEGTANPVTTMEQYVATSQHRIMGLQWMLPICQKGDQLCLQNILSLTDMATEGTTNPVSSMVRSVATSQHRIMGSQWMLPICQKGGQPCLQMPMIRQMKVWSMTVNQYSGKTCEVLKYFSHILRKPSKFVFYA